MKLRFEIIAHKNHRYPTAGDYYQHKGVWWFKVSRMKDKRYMWLVFLHEMIEWSLCRLWGIKQREIDKFDKAYEASRPDTGGWNARLTSNFEECAPCGCRHLDEPGDDIHAPYHDAHAVASECERLIAKALNVDWVKYDETVAKL